MSVNPNEGMDALRKIEEAKAEHDIVSATMFPSGCVPQVAINDKKMYPLYAKCVELDIPICINGGIVGPRMPSWPQHVEQLRRGLLRLPRAHDRDDARRRAVDRARGEAHAQVAGPALHDRARSRPSTTRRRSSTTPTPAAPTRSCTAATSRPASRSSASSQDMPNVPVQGRRVAEVPARERAARVQDPRGDRARHGTTVRQRSGRAHGSAGQLARNHVDRVDRRRRCEEVVGLLHEQRAAI